MEIKLPAYLISYSSHAPAQTIFSSVAGLKYQRYLSSASHFYTVLYYTLLCYAIPNYTTLYDTRFYSTLLYSTLLCSPLLSSSLFCSALLYCAILYYTILCYTKIKQFYYQRTEDALQSVDMIDVLKIHLKPLKHTIEKLKET